MATLEGEEGGEKPMGGVAREWEVGDGVVRDWTSNALGDVSLEDGANASDKEAQVINPDMKMKQKSALNGSIMHASYC